MKGAEMRPAEAPRLLAEALPTRYASTSVSTLIFKRSEAFSAQRGTMSIRLWASATSSMMKFQYRPWSISRLSVSASGRSTFSVSPIL